MNKHYIIGIDEAGRGPWAGPVVAGGWMSEENLFQKYREILEGLDDSKKLSQHEREKIFTEIECMQYRDECQFAFAYRDAPSIDMLGIREANRQCMQDVLLSLLQFTDDNDTIDIYIDGCDNYMFEVGEFTYTFAQKKSSRSKISSQKSQIIGLSQLQKSITYVIHGDALIPAISAASIIAKVTRDRILCDFHEDFPQYGFDTHKGYGTKKHQEALINYGITPIHRKSYAPVKRLISQTSSL